MLRALIWDVDGTLAETERDGHRVAFNRAFESLGVPWRWSEQRYGELLAVAGGRERLLHDMRSQPGAPADAARREVLADRIHLLKNQFYARIVTGGGLPLRPGVRDLLHDCEREGLRMAIATTTSRANVEILLQTHLGHDWASRFAAVLCSREAPRKKPDPEVYTLALGVLEVQLHESVALEDAPAGIAAAMAAGVPVVVTHSHYFPAPDIPGLLASGPSLAQPDGWVPGADVQAARIGLRQIRRWYAHRRAQNGDGNST
jgi:HAD superfamily hydrolase (TIGR01509 family)